MWMAYARRAGLWLSLASISISLTGASSNMAESRICWKHCWPSEGSAWWRTSLAQSDEPHFKT